MNALSSYSKEKMLILVEKNRVAFELMRKIILDTLFIGIYRF